MKKLKDYKNGITYIFFSGKLDNGYTLYLRMPVTAIEDSVRISNNFLYLIAGFINSNWRNNNTCSFKEIYWTNTWIKWHSKKNVKIRF